MQMSRVSSANGECPREESVCISSDKHDETDHAPYHFHVTVCDILCLVTSIVTHIIDVGFDIHLAYRYYHSNNTERKMLYFGLTLIFILFPALVNTVMSTRMYVKDEDSMSLGKIWTKKWGIRIIILIFQLAPILRYCESLRYALKSRRAEKKNKFVEQRKYYELMLKEDSDAALLRVFECFLEAAPQQVLQITILLLENGQDWSWQYISQMCSIISSLCSMAWSMASYHRTIRFVQEDKNNISVCGTVLQFLWHFMVTVSRIFSISIAASLLPSWTIFASVTHWLIMLLWLKLTSRLVFCVEPGDSFITRSLGELLFGSVLALVYIFTFITPEEGHTRNRYILFYSVCFLENVCGVTIGATAHDSGWFDAWYFYPLLCACILPFAAGIGFMVLYYLYFHPIHLKGLKKPSGQERAIQTENFKENVQSAVSSNIIS